MNTFNSYKIIDLGKCNLTDKDNSILYIPSLQRGLVWKPEQIELLWDSLLRQFPIGSLIVYQKEPSQGELLDGQQRVNAIITGFNKDIDQKSDCIIWVDLNNSLKLNNREFNIRVTTRAHPWGYRLDGSVYEASVRKNAIIKAGYEPGSKKSEWNILNFGPEAEGDDDVVPIPLSFIINSIIERPGEKDNSIIDCIKDKCENCSSLFENRADYKNELLKIIDVNRVSLCSYIKAIRKILYNEIPAIIINQDEDIEEIFKRIGIQGTAITKKELSYALMKSYWSDKDSNKDFGCINRQLSRNLVSEEDFAQLVFRLYVSKDTLHGDITPEYVRKLKKSNSDICDSIINAYKDNGKTIKELTDTIDEWVLTYVGNEKYHNLIITEIASNKPDIYVLLLRLAKFCNDNNKRFQLKPAYIQALTFYLYVCLKNNKANKAINVLYSKIMLQEKENKIISEEFVSKLLCEFICLEWSIPAIDSFKDFRALNEDAFNPRWDYGQFRQEKGYLIFERLFQYGIDESAFVLKLAESNYFKTHYSDYIPSRKDLWEGLNRPWDHDHIIPQKWVKDNPQFSDKWINSIGNIADIPSELNRKKQDSPDWNHYCENWEGLVFPKEGLNISDLTSEDSIKISFKFIKKRFLDITNPFLSILNRLELSNYLSENQQLRKDFLMKAKEKHPECSFYYLSNEIESSFDEDDNYGWQQPWISLMKDFGNPKRVISLTVNINNDSLFQIEWGWRKRPELHLDEMNNKNWWEDNYVEWKKMIITKTNGVIETNCKGENLDPLEKFDDLINKSNNN